MLRVLRTPLRGPLTRLLKLIPTIATSACLLTKQLEAHDHGPHWPQGHHAVHVEAPAHSAQHIDSAQRRSRVVCARVVRPNHLRFGGGL